LVGKTQLNEERADREKRPLRRKTDRGKKAIWGDEFERGGRNATLNGIKKKLEGWREIKVPLSYSLKKTSEGVPEGATEESLFCGR